MWTNASMRLGVNQPAVTVCCLIRTGWSRCGKFAVRLGVSVPTIRVLEKAPQLSHWDFSRTHCLLCPGSMSWMSCYLHLNVISTDWLNSKNRSGSALRERIGNARV